MYKLKINVPGLKLSLKTNNYQFFQNFNDILEFTEGEHPEETSKTPLEIAKEKYAGDPIVGCAYDGLHAKIKSNTIREHAGIPGRILAEPYKFEAHWVIYDPDTDKWADIITQ